MLSQKVGCGQATTDLLIPPQIKLLDLIVEVAALYVQHLGSLRHIPVEFAELVLDE